MDRRNKGKTAVTGSKVPQIKAKPQALEYLSDSKAIVDKCLTSAGSEEQLWNIFRISLATESVLAGLATRDMKPPLGPARSIVLRIPMLTAIGQGSIAGSEMRRFLELIFWTIYFTDHP